MMRKHFFLSIIACSIATAPTNTLTFPDISTWISDTYASISGNVFTNHRVGLYVACIAFWIAYVRLQSKRTDKSGTIYQWKDLLKVWNICSKEYWNTFDALVIGEPFKLMERSVSEKISDTKTVKEKDKTVKCTPKGIMGLIDAYFLIQIENILKLINNIDKLHDRSANFIAVGQFVDKV